MVPLRLLTSAGIFVGASLGALLAVWTGPVPPAIGAPSTTTHRPAVEVQRVESSALVPVATAQVARRDAPPEPREPGAKSLPSAEPRREQALAPTAEAVREAMLSCARGDDDDCLRAAEAIEAGRGVAADAKRARDFRATAIKRYARRCTHRDPDACYAFSMLHARGFGVKQDAASARVLLERARLACRTRQAAICERL
jgi:hypothetical protein